MGRAVLSAVALVVLLAVALYFAPTRLGGDMVYFRVVGTSMQPLLHGGDLAVLRGAEHYQIGDTVAYQDPTLGVVVHSIRALDGGRFITRGLNRSDDDPYRPAPADIHGKLWFNVPGGGDTLRTLQTPRNAVLLLIATGALSAIPVRKQLRKHTRRWTRSSPAPKPGGPGIPILGSPAGDSIATLAIVAILVAGAAAFVLRTNGPVQETTTDALIEQTGTWAYGAAGVGHGIYDGDRLTTGQPAFTALNRSLPAQFAYTIAPLSDADAITEVRGDVRVTVELSAVNKWSRSIELLPTTPFEGAATVASTTLDIGQLLAIAEAVHEQTGVEFGTYRTHITAHVRVTALANGQPLEQALTAILPFDLTTVQMLPIGDPTEPIKEVTKVARPTTQPWRMMVPVLRQELSYEQLRLLAIGLGGGGTLALLVVVGTTVITWRKGEGALIRARHGQLIVTSPQAEAAVEGRVVAVAAFSELLRVAAYEQTFIVDAPAAGLDHFLVPVRGSGCTYRYSVPCRAGAAPAQPSGGSVEAALLAGWSLSGSRRVPPDLSPRASSPAAAERGQRPKPLSASGIIAAGALDPNALPASAVPPRAAPPLQVLPSRPIPQPMRVDRAPIADAITSEVPPWLLPPSAGPEVPSQERAA